jgi:phosphinothricin acetyltransferase
VAETAISFEEVPPGAAEMRARIEALAGDLPWLVAESRGVLGDAYASPHRARAAYRWSVDVSAYVAAGARRSGVGRQLYAALLRALERQGYYNAFAGITLPNDASERFHRACGFEALGIYRNVGFKFGAWHDTIWMQRRLRTDADEPAEPVPLARLELSDVFGAG